MRYKLLGWLVSAVGLVAETLTKLGWKAEVLQHRIDEKQFKVWKEDNDVHS